MKSAFRRILAFLLALTLAVGPCFADFTPHATASFPTINSNSALFQMEALNTEARWYDHLVFLSRCVFEQTRLPAAIAAHPKIAWGLKTVILTGLGLLLHRRPEFKTILLGFLVPSPGQVPMKWVPLAKPGIGTRSLATNINVDIRDRLAANLEKARRRGLFGVLSVAMEMPVQINGKKMKRVGPGGGGQGMFMSEQPWAVSQRGVAHSVVSPLFYDDVLYGYLGNYVETYGSAVLQDVVEQNLERTLPKLIKALNLSEEEIRTRARTGDAVQLVRWADIMGIGEAAVNAYRTRHGEKALMKIAMEAYLKQYRGEKLMDIELPMGNGTYPFSVYCVEQEGVPVLQFFDDSGEIWRRVYSMPNPDSVGGYVEAVLLPMAAIEVMRQLDIEYESVHFNDWQTALGPVMLETLYDKAQWPLGHRPASVFTIHNLEYQGIFPGHLTLDPASSLSQYLVQRNILPAGESQVDLFRLTGLDRSLQYDVENGLEYYGNDVPGKHNLMKGAILHAAKILFVSEGHAGEAFDEKRSYGLRGIFNRVRDRVGYVYNGVRADRNQPQNLSELDRDGFKKPPKPLARMHPSELLKWKIFNRLALQKKLGLEVSPNNLVLGFVTRIVKQKGLNILMTVMPSGKTLLQEILDYRMPGTNGKIQIPILGSAAEDDVIGQGQAKFFRDFQDAHPEYRNQFIFIEGFDPVLAKQIGAGSDMVGMFSIDEPGGIANQELALLLAMVIATNRGGLKDFKKRKMTPLRLVDGFESDDTPEARLQRVKSADQILQIIDEVFFAYHRQPVEYAENWLAPLSKIKAAWGDRAGDYIEAYKSAIESIVPVFRSALGAALLRLARTRPTPAEFLKSLKVSEGVRHPRRLITEWKLNPTERILGSMNWEAALFQGARVLDLTAGCGPMSVYAALLGAREVWAIDSNEQALADVRANAKEWGVQDTVHTLLKDLRLDRIEDLGSFDIVLVDPDPFYQKRTDWSMTSIVKEMPVDREGEFLFAFLKDIAHSAIGEHGRALLYADAIAEEIISSEGFKRDVLEVAPSELNMNRGYRLFEVFHQTARAHSESLRLPESERGGLVSAGLNQLGFLFLENLLERPHLSFTLEQIQNLMNLTPDRYSIAADQLKILLERGYVRQFEAKVEVKSEGKEAVPATVVKYALVRPARRVARPESGLGVGAAGFWTWIGIRSVALMGFLEAIATTIGSFWKMVHDAHIPGAHSGHLFADIAHLSLSAWPVILGFGIVLFLLHYFTGVAQAEEHREPVKQDLWLSFRATGVAMTGFLAIPFAALALLVSFWWWIPAVLIAVGLHPFLNWLNSRRIHHNFQDDVETLYLRFSPKLQSHVLELASLLPALNEKDAVTADIMKERLQLMDPRDEIALQYFEEDLKWFLTHDRINGSYFLPQENPKVSFVILHYGHDAEATLRLLRSLEHQTYENFNVIVIDNNSPDGFSHHLDEYVPSLPNRIRQRLSVVSNQTNMGFSGGNNQGARIAIAGGSDYVCFINNDGTLETSGLEKMVKTMGDHSEIGALAPYVYLYPEDEEPAVHNAMTSGGEVPPSARSNALKNQNSFIGKLKNNPHAAAEPVPGVVGVFYKEPTLLGTMQLARSDLIRLSGGFDSRLFMYGDEDDAAYRYQRTGLRKALTTEVWFGHPIFLNTRSFRSQYSIWRNKMFIAEQYYGRGPWSQSIMEAGEAYQFVRADPSRSFNLLHERIQASSAELQRNLMFIGIFKGVTDGILGDINPTLEHPGVDENARIQAYAEEFLTMHSGRDVLARLLDVEDPYESRLMIYGLYDVREKMQLDDYLSAGLQEKLLSIQKHYVEEWTEWVRTKERRASRIQDIRKNYLSDVDRAIGLGPGVSGAAVLSASDLELYSDFSDTFIVPPPGVQTFPSHEQELRKVVAESIGDQATREKFNTQAEQGYRLFNEKRRDSSIPINERYGYWLKPFTGLLNENHLRDLSRGWRLNPRFFEAADLVRTRAGLGPHERLEITIETGALAPIVRFFLQRPEVAAELAMRRIRIKVDAVDIEMDHGVFTGRIISPGPLVSVGAQAYPPKCLVFGDDAMDQPFIPFGERLLNVQRFDRTVIEQRIDTYLAQIAPTPGAAGLFYWLGFRDPVMIGKVEGIFQSILGAWVFLHPAAQNSVHAFAAALVALFALHFFTGVVGRNGEKPVPFQFKDSGKATFTSLAGFMGWPLMALGLAASGPLHFALFAAGFVVGPLLHGKANETSILKMQSILKSA